MLYLTNIAKFQQPRKAITQPENQDGLNKERDGNPQDSHREKHKGRLHSSLHVKNGQPLCLQKCLHLSFFKGCAELHLPVFHKALVNIGRICPDPSCQKRHLLGTDDVLFGKKIDESLFGNTAHF